MNQISRFHIGGSISGVIILVGKRPGNTNLIRTRLFVFPVVLIHLRSIGI